MDATVFSPRKTRAQSRKAAGRASQGVDGSTAVSIEASSSQVSTPAIVLLPEKLKAKSVGLNVTDLEILLKKQAWLRTYKIALLQEDQSLQKIVNATLVFGQEAAGTAVCIAEKGLLLTCSHCVAETEDEFDREKTHCLLFASGQIVRAKCVAWDAKRDVALLRIVAAQAPHDSTFSTLPIATKAPKNKDQLVCVGHPGSEDLEASLPGLKTNYDTLYVSTGAFCGYATGQDLQDNSEIGSLQHNCWTYWGHSGAPLVLRKTGELVGLHSSWDDTTGMRRGVPVEALLEFCQENVELLAEFEYTLAST